LAVAPGVPKQRERGWGGARRGRSSWEREKRKKKNMAARIFGSDRKRRRGGKRDRAVPEKRGKEKKVFGS